MTDLPEVEREAFRCAFSSPFDDLGPAGICTCDTYPLPIEDHGDECAVRALYEGWMARREYSKQREEELERALAGSERERIENTTRLLKREEELREAAAFLRSCLRSGEISGADHPLVVAALAENGDSVSGIIEMRPSLDEMNDGLGHRRPGWL